MYERIGMANNINWGQIYCYTEFGNEDKTIAESIPAFSAPSCFVGAKVSGQIETLAFTIDAADYKASSGNLTTDQSIVTLF